MSERVTVFISLEPDESGLGWEIHKGSVAVSNVVRKLPEPMRKTGTLVLSEEEKDKILRVVRRNLFFKEVSTSY